MTFPKEDKEGPCFPVHALLRMAVAERYTLRELSRYSDSLTVKSGWILRNLSALPSDQTGS